MNTALTLSISKAEMQDAEQIAALINLAYRGESSKQGWTTEADLLDGRRSDIEEILQLISSAFSMFLLCKRQAELIVVVNLQKQDEQVCLGMLAVNPPLQANGIGKQLLLNEGIVTTTLKTIFQKPVNRPIEGVIKADDEACLRLEIEEYVLTNEVEKSLKSFLDAYNNYEGANGVWVSGFFGSGKSASRYINIAFDKAWLADETDVERYLVSMRKALLEEIRKGKSIQI